MGKSTPPPANEPVDVAIVGAGPIGLEAAVELRRAGASTINIDAGCIGSTMHWWAPGTRFFSSPERIAIAGVPIVVAGQEKATREDYLAYLRGVAEQFDLRLHLYERVVGIGRTGDIFTLRTRPSSHGVGGPPEALHGSGFIGEQSGAIRARHIVLAIGNMHRPRLLNVEGESLPHVSHYLHDPHLYARRRVVIVGGRNSAVEAAIRLYRVGAQVTMVHRRIELERDRIKYWLLPELEWLIAKRRIDWRSGACVTRITERRVHIAAPDGESIMDADTVLLLTGYIQDGKLFDMLGIRREGPDLRPVLNDVTMESSVPGVYVAGTAVGGSQSKVTVFIENAHEHVGKVVRSITGRRADSRPIDIPAGLEES